MPDGIVVKTADAGGYSWKVTMWPGSPARWSLSEVTPGEFFRAIGHFQSQGHAEQALADYVEARRNPTGYACPECGHPMRVQGGDRYLCPEQCRIVHPKPWRTWDADELAAAGVRPEPVLCGDPDGF